MVIVRYLLIWNMFCMIRMLKENLLFFDKGKWIEKI